MFQNLFDEPLSEINLLPENGEVYYYGKILNVSDADKYFQALMQLPSWQNDVVSVYGKKIVTARKTAWYGDNNVAYEYSGSTKIALPWVDELLEIKNTVEAITKDTFNSCLLNLYHNGSEGMSWHSDNETCLGAMPVIASISLGAERSFVFRSNNDQKKTSINLEHGSLLLMRGYTQSHYQHALPKSLKVKSPRINLTYRRIFN